MLVESEPDASMTGWRPPLRASASAAHHARADVPTTPSGRFRTLPTRFRTAGRAHRRIPAPPAPPFHDDPSDRRRRGGDLRVGDGPAPGSPRAAAFERIVRRCEAVDDTHGAVPSGPTLRPLLAGLSLASSRAHRPAPARQGASAVGGPLRLAAAGARHHPAPPFMGLPPARPMSGRRIRVVRDETRACWSFWMDRPISWSACCRRPSSRLCAEGAVAPVVTRGVRVSRTWCPTCAGGPTADLGCAAIRHAIDREFIVGTSCGLARPATGLLPATRTGRIAPARGCRLRPRARPHACWTRPAFPRGRRPRRHPTLRSHTDPLRFRTLALVSEPAAGAVGRPGGAGRSSSGRLFSDVAAATSSSSAQVGGRSSSRT